MQLVLVIASAVVAVSQAQFLPGTVFSPNVYEQKQALARRFGILEKNENKGLRLSCTGIRNTATYSSGAAVSGSVSFTALSFATDRMIKVTVQMRKHDSGTSHHHHHRRFGPSYGYPYAGPAALAFGAAAYAPQNPFGRAAPFAFGHVHHQHRHDNKLTANIEIQNQGGTDANNNNANRFVTGKFKIILTERGVFPMSTFTIANTDTSLASGTNVRVTSATQCTNFGSGLKVDDDSFGHRHLGTFAGPAAFFHTQQNQRDKDPKGVIGEVDFGTVAANAAGTRAVTIDKLKGFHNLEQLDGRGIILCPVNNVDEDFEGKAECSSVGEGFCCGLTYEKDTKSTTTTG